MSQGGWSFPLRNISDGGSGCSADALSGNPWPNPAVAFFDNTCEDGMMCGTAENRATRNGGQWWWSVKMVRKSGFLTYVCDFLAVFSVRHAQTAGIILKLR